MAGKISEEARKRYQTAKTLWLVYCVVLVSLSFPALGDLPLRGVLIYIVITPILIIAGMVAYAEGNALNHNKTDLLRRLRRMQFATRIFWILAALAFLLTVIQFAPHKKDLSAELSFLFRLFVVARLLTVAICLKIITYKLMKRIVPTKPTPQIRKKPRAEYTDESF